MRGQVFALARATFLEALRDRILLVVVLFAVAVMLTSRLLGWISIEDEIKMLLDFSLSGMGLMVLLPSQMAIVEDFSRRWTDIIWSGVRGVRESMEGHSVNRIYYGILFMYVAWSFFCAYAFSTKPRLMTLVIANLNNVALGLTAFHLLWVNRRLLPGPLRPRWYSQLGLLLCGGFYFGLATLVFCHTQLPGLREYFGV